MRRIFRSGSLREEAEVLGINDFRISVFDDENNKPSYQNNQLETGAADAKDTIITDEVVAIVHGHAAQAALATDSVASMSSNMAGDIVESLGVRNPTKGVAVRTNEGRVILDLYIIVKYGKKISDIAWNVQENVKKEVENMTGAVVESVNIHVSGVDFTQKAKKA